MKKCKFGDLKKVAGDGTVVADGDMERDIVDIKPLFIHFAKQLLYDHESTHPIALVAVTEKRDV